MVQIKVWCIRCAHDQNKPHPSEWVENAYLKLHLEGGRRVCPWGCGHQGLHVGIIAVVGKPLKA